jgi:hypothetical protein
MGISIYSFEFANEKQNHHKSAPPNHSLSWPSDRPNHTSTPNSEWHRSSEAPHPTSVDIKTSVRTVVPPALQKSRDFIPNLQQHAQHYEYHSYPTSRNTHPSWVGRIGHTLSLLQVPLRPAESQATALDEWSFASWPSSLPLRN